MQSGCNERRCYCEDGLLSPLNSSDKDIIRHYLCVQLGAAIPVPLTKASFSEGDNGVGLEELCCN